MLLIICKVELKLKWTTQCVLASAGIENADGSYNKINFAI